MSRSAGRPSDRAADAPRILNKSDQVTRGLEGVRQRLGQLAEALNKYASLIANHPTMPPWPVLQAQAAIVAASMAGVTQYISENHANFGDAIIFPEADFPQAAIDMQVLGILLRKKLEPGVEDWILSGRAIGDGAVRPAPEDLPSAELGQTGKAGTDEDDTFDPSAVITTGSDSRPSYKQWTEFWAPLRGKGYEEAWGKWMGPRAEFGYANSQEWQGARFAELDYTKAEREAGVENVKTGLKRELRSEPPMRPQSESGSDVGDTPGSDDDDEVMGNTGSQQSTAQLHEPVMDMNSYLRFMNMGVLPDGFGPNNGAPANIAGV